VTTDDAIAMVELFLATEFAGGRHQGRVDKIALR
jgi:ribose 5-phosphate isomerase RpiB